MGRPLAVVLAATCDRDKLVADVEELAREHHLSYRTAWKYVRDMSSTPEWMVIIAEEEIQKSIDEVRKFWAFLDDDVCASQK